MPYKAQDTGFAFFKYIRKKYPEQNAFYIVDFRFPESNRVRELGNAIDFRSKKHILYIIGARRIISSHHPDYLYPSKMKSLKKKIKAKKIFLQHGVLGVKNMAGNYGNFSNGFYVDEFIASSDREKQIIVKDLHYSSKNVHVTGLSRFDELFNNNTKVKRQLLIIPTWRDWITSNQNFMETEYYNRYAQLISSERLLNLAKKYDFSIVFCLHPNMQMYTHLFQRFQNNFVKIVKQGEISVQQLLKESCLMITDYSSVAFDFSFLNKPIIYYQFDREKFLGKKGSHIDLDNELPGKICYDLTNLLNLVEEYCINNFKNPIKYKKRSEKFIKYKDQSSCDRIYKVVKNAKKNRYRFKNFLFIKVTSKLFKKLSSAI
jgi:CDP-glycerol glycerophosphotransferase